MTILPKNDTLRRAVLCRFQYPYYTIMTALRDRHIHDKEFNRMVIEPLEVVEIELYDILERVIHHMIVNKKGDV